MLIVPSRKANAMLAEWHAHKKLHAAFQTGDRAFVEMKVRAWQRIAQAQRKAT